MKKELKDNRLKLFSVDNALVHTTEKSIKSLEEMSSVLWLSCCQN